MDLDQILKLSPAAALGVALLMVGFFLKKSPIQDWLIPWLIGPLGAAVYPWISIAPKEGPKNAFMLETIYGAIIGLTVVGGHQAFKQYLEFRDKKKEGLPEGDTAIIKRSDPEPGKDK